MIRIAAAYYFLSSRLSYMKKRCYLRREFAFTEYCDNDRQNGFSG